MPSKKFFSLKKTLIFLGSILCALLIFSALLPWIVSKETGKQVLISFLNKKLPGTLEIKTLSLHWNGPQEIMGLSYKSDDGKFKLFYAKTLCNASLFSILLPSHDLGFILIEEPLVEIHQTIIPTPLHTMPEVQAASFSPSVYFPAFTMPFIGNLKVQNAKASLFTENLPPIFFHLHEIRLIASKDSSELSLHVEGTTLQDNIEGSLLLNSLLTKSDSIDRSLESTVLLKNFPIDGLDQIFSLKHPEYRKVFTEAIGPSLDMECTLSFSKNSCNASFQAKSDNLQAFLKTETQKEAITLASPSSFQMTLSPALLKKAKELFPNLKAFVSEKPLKLSLSLDHLKIPQAAEGISFESSSFQGKINIDSYQMENFTLGCIGSFSSLNFSDEVISDIQIDLRNKKEMARSIAHLSCKKPLSSKEVTASFELGKTPSSFLETLLPFSNLFGNSIEGSLTLQGQAQKFTINIALTSPLLQIEKGVFTWENQKLSLEHPFQIHYLMYPTTFHSLLKQENLILEKEIDLTATVSKLSSNDISSLEDLKIETSIAASPLIFSKLFSLKNYNIDNLSFNLEIDSISKIALQVKSNRFNLIYSGGIDKKQKTLFWKTPIQLDYLLTEKELSVFHTLKPRAFFLEKAPLHIEIEPASLTLNPFSFNQVLLTAHLQSKELLFQNRPHTKQMSLQNFQTKVRFLGAKDIASFSLTSDLSFDSLAQGKISCQGNVKQLSSATPAFKADLELQKFPLELVDIFIDSSTSLTPLLGSSLDLKLLIDQQNTSQMFQIAGKSPYLEISGGISSDSKGIFLTDPKKPLILEFLLTPKAYAYISNKTKTPFTLTQETLFKASLSDLRLPFLSKDSKLPDFSHLLVNAQIENPFISFQHKETTLPLTLTNSKISLQKENIQAPLSLFFDALADSSEKGTIHLKAECKKLFDDKGQIHLSHIHSDLTASFDKFPSSILDIIFPPKNANSAPLSILLGPSLNMTVKASLENASGPLTLNLKSKNVVISLDAKLTSGILTLQKNAQAQISLTPESSRVFLQEVNPLSISSISAASPITLEIDSSGFFLPISPFLLNRIEMPNIRIIPGKIFCKNEGNINLMLGILKSKQEQQSKQLELWFAPLDLHIRQGIINLERTEILVANTYDIALWGRIDLPSDRVNMTLGLTASCLKAAFNLKDLPKSYMLHIPLTGTLNHVELNKSAASSKIVALTLWQNANVVTPAAKGLGGALIGGLMNKVLSPPGNDSDTPPAKEPFPWQK